jgi:hypothetical protein
MKAEMDIGWHRDSGRYRQRRQQHLGDSNGLAAIGIG